MSIVRMNNKGTNKKDSRKKSGNDCIPEKLTSFQKSIKEWEGGEMQPVKDFGTLVRNLGLRKIG